MHEILKIEDVDNFKFTYKDEEKSFEVAIKDRKALYRGRLLKLYSSGKHIIELTEKIDDLQNG
jgi:hypothetical protein